MAKPIKFAKGTTFSMSGGYAPAVIEMELAQSTSEEVEDTTLADSVKKSVATGVSTVGDLKVTVRYEPDTEPALAVAGAADETITITYPIYGSDSTANTHTFTGHIKDKTRPKLGIGGERPTQVITIQSNSEWTYNENN